jgi:hypothetical protein
MSVTIVLAYCSTELITVVIFGVKGSSGLYYKHITIVNDDSKGVIYAPRVFNYAPREHLWYRCLS